MSTIDQCPSTGKPETLATAKRDEARSLTGARAVSSATGKSYWRSLDDMVGTKPFRDFVEREFPAHASELLDGSRRHFLKIMGASLALAGAATIPGCRRPDHKIIAYNTAPEGIVPGKPLYYATVMRTPGGGAEGLLATTFEGRPTKLEGNPLHPLSLGKTSMHGQSWVLDLYNPDRSPEIARERTRGTDAVIDATPWDEFERTAATDFGAFDTTQGRRLAFLVDKDTSPTRERLKARILERWPEAMWVPYDPMENAGELRGTAIAFGRPMKTDLRLEHADTVVCFDHDVLASEGGIAESRAFSRKRFVPGEGDRYAADAEMSRLYSIESRMTPTGGQADHRYPCRASRVGAFAIDLAKALQNAGVEMPAPIADRLASLEGGEARESWIKALVDDLWGPGGTRAGTSVLVCGASQPAWVHALVAAMNEALGNLGKSVVYREMEGDLGADSESEIAKLASSIRGGDIGSLVVLGGNPAYDAPADLNMESLIAGVDESYYLGEPNETAAAAGTYLHAAHGLESWGDAVGHNKTHSVVQPMIAPLYGGKTDVEMLAMILGIESDGYVLVRDTMAERTGVARTVGGARNTNFEKLWRRALHDGFVAGTTVPDGLAPGVDASRVAGAIDADAVAMMNVEGIEAVFQPCPKVLDGRFANNGWLQELPDTVGKITWDNPVHMSKATAERLGLNPSRKLGEAQYNEVQVVEVTIEGTTIQAPLWVQPGMPNDQIALTLGYGRRSGGRICEGTGVDVTPLRRSGGMGIATGVEVVRARGRKPYLIATTQDHWSLEGRDGIVREVDLYWWKKEGDTDFNVDKDGKPKKDAYKQKRDLNPAAMLGIEGHAPVNEEVYLNEPDKRGSEIYYHRVNKKGYAVKVDEAGRFFAKNSDGKYEECD
ncbi:MAG: TAT-variant-translocated molybdopterin oxidoreductase, partial [Planctomycetota bacterium]